jgi:branched-chain amino acid transport system permease protein
MRALLAVLLALPLVIDSFFLGEVTNVLIWAIAGLGLMLLTGQTGQVSLGHSAFMALGCYTCVLLMEAGVPFLAAFLLAGIITGLFGALIAIPALRCTGSTWPSPRWRWRSWPTTSSSCWRPGPAA